MAGIPGIGFDASVVGKPINSFVAGRGVCSSTNFSIVSPPRDFFLRFHRRIQSISKGL